MWAIVIDTPYHPQIEYFDSQSEAEMALSTLDISAACFYVGDSVNLVEIHDRIFNGEN